jgi:hypothetical protein
MISNCKALIECNWKKDLCYRKHIILIYKERANNSTWIIRDIKIKGNAKYDVELKMFHFKFIRGTKHLSFALL